jgi:hypothetical protein
MGDYERHQIESLLLSGSAKPESGLFISRDDISCRVLYDAAVGPALLKNGIGRVTQRVFDSDSSLAEACKWVLSAEVIIAEVDRQCGDLMYVLGLCHGLKRCPLLIHPQGEVLPFNLQALRCIGYRDDSEGLRTLREELARCVRIFLAASRAAREE